MAFIELPVAAKNGSHLGFLPFIIILEKKGLFDRIRRAKLPLIARFGE